MPILHSKKGENLIAMDLVTDNIDSYHILTPSHKRSTFSLCILLLTCSLLLLFGCAEASDSFPPEGESPDSSTTVFLDEEGSTSTVDDSVDTEYPPSDDGSTDNVADSCPDDPNKNHPGLCGCGVPDTDGDVDGTPDCKDDCPLDPNKTKPGICGCGTPEDVCIDSTPPKIVPPTIPAFGSNDVPPAASLVATFDEPIALISGGTVTLRNLNFGSKFDVVISLPNGQVSVSGVHLTINPLADLGFSTDYAVQISVDAVEDLKGNRFAGISADEWNFRTSAFPFGVEVTPDHIVSGVVTGKLLAIDVPSVPAIPAAGGPDWPGTADDGFTTVNSPLREDDGISRWEPDGTPLNEAKAYRVHDGGNPSVKYVFDLPDGARINAVYGTWNRRSTDGCTYSFAEGLVSDSVLVRQDIDLTVDLVLKWTDDVGTVRHGSFQRLFKGPITVEGDNGFELWAWDNYGNAAHVDAVVLDASY